MDFSSTPTSKHTTRIMRQIEAHLKVEDPATGHLHYNAVYEIIHRELLAAVLVARLPKAQGVQAGAHD